MKTALILVLLSLALFTDSARPKFVESEPVRIESIA